MAQIINLENNLKLRPNGGPVSVIIQAGHPVQPQADLALRFTNHATTPIAAPAIIGQTYGLGPASSLIGKAANVCWGQIFTPGAGSMFSLYCEFFQDGQSIGTSDNVQGVTTGSVVTFSTSTIFV
jgi:hypothetical protein